MTAIMLALMFSDATLNANEASEYRLVENHDQESAPQRRMREWTPGIETWKIENESCPAFFQRDIKGFGVFRVGPKCTEEEVPHAL